MPKIETIPTLTWDQCCQIILKECPDQYAKAYASAGYGMEGEEQRVQALYLQGNITYWRGPNAKPVRDAVKYYGKRH